MKILKIFFILLMPAIGIVGCKKSNVRPHDCGNKASTENSEGTRLNTNFTQVGDDTYQSTDVVGSGDDDRDGGDKPKRVGSK